VSTPHRRALIGVLRRNPPPHPGIGPDRAGRRLRGADRAWPAGPRMTTAGSARAFSAGCRAEARRLLWASRPRRRRLRRALRAAWPSKPSSLW